jgi:hypothetical protein
MYGGDVMKRLFSDIQEKEIVDKYLNKGYTVDLLLKDYNCNKSTIESLFFVAALV